jgi:hypothetical protein
VSPQLARSGRTDPAELRPLLKAEGTSLICLQPYLDPREEGGVPWYLGTLSSAQARVLYLYTFAGRFSPAGRGSGRPIGCLDDAAEAYGRDGDKIEL